MKIGRNSPCPCGSGKKYKKCCLDRHEKRLSQGELDKIREMLESQQRPEPNLNIVQSVIWKNQRWRVIWNRLYPRPITETFHEFILAILRETFGGEEWRREQMELPLDERHILIQWFYALHAWQLNNQKDENKEPDSAIWKAVPSGEVQALISLAYDVYCLQIVNKLPEHIIKRLTNRKEFQGARYEIAVAAIIARSGFEITFLDDSVKSEVHCEFIAKHKYTGIEVGVEAKSRRRKGVLHEDGEFEYESAVKGDIKHLFRKARAQKPKDMPFIIFIDLNIPPTPHIPLDQKPWIRDIQEILANYRPSPTNPDPFNLAVFTNFSFYYGGNEGETPGGECFVVETEVPETPLKDKKLLYEIENSLKRYAHIPKEV